jgi:hypothetical protein
VDHALQEGARRQHHAAGAVGFAAGAQDTHDLAVLDDEVLDGLGHDRQVRRGGELGLHGLAIELTVDLRARSAHRCALGAVQHAELDARLVGQTAHQAVECVDLADEMPLAQAADSRVAAHFTDRFDLVGEEQGARAVACGGRGGLAPGVPAADDDHVPGHERLHIGERSVCFT